MTVEEYIKQKRNELDKMIPGFIDKELSDTVLNFYERGIKEGIEFGKQEMEQQMIKEAMPRKVKFLDSISYSHCIAHLGMSEDDTVKLIIIKED